MTQRRRGMFATWIWLLAAPAFAADITNGTGTLTGTVTLHGRVTSEIVLSVTDPEGKIVSNRTGETEPGRAIVDQRGMKFLPRVSAVRVGTLVSFPNNDKSWHNVYSASETKPFDLGLYPRGESRGVVMDQVGVVRILCNVHPTMEAFVVVIDHPFFAVPNDRGVYRIPSLPVGEYRLQTWHPEAGATTTPFRISHEGEVKVRDIELKPTR